ncbi:MAG: hypothetical protein WC314_19355 [Vulcanimicrobiota bacterium]
MDFDPRDLIEANLALLQEAAALAEPTPALLMTVATWGRGADPAQLKALQPYRHGLGFNGSVVARVPLEQARDWIPEDAFLQLQAEADKTLVYSAVFKDWVLEPL